MHDFERNAFKLAGLGIIGVVVYDALNHSDGLIGLAKAVLGTYTTTLNTIAGK